MIKCPNCTAQLAFDVIDQMVKCDYCGSTFNPAQVNASLNVASENVSVVTNQVENVNEEIDAVSYNCNNCGAVLLVFDDTAVTFCNYCGSSNMIKSNLIKQTKPDYIIPFSIDKNKCIELYKKKIKKNIFAPRHMLDDAVVSNFRGIYMPYEIYNFVPNPKMTCTGRKFYKRRGNYDYYHIYTINGELDGYISGLSYDCVSKFYDRYSETIAPFYFSKAKEFNSAYLSGFYADSIDINENSYGSLAEVNAEKIASNILSKDLRFYQYGCMYPRADMVSSGRKVAMYPVYFLGVRDKNNENIYYAVINGQTGKVAIDIPIDYKRYIIISLLLAVGLFFVFLNFTVDIFTPIYFSILASIFAFILGRVITSNINKNRSLDEDLGYANRKNKNKNNVIKSKKETGITSIICPILAFCLSIFIIVSGVVDDIYYYGCTIISCILLLISFYDVVISYNKLSKNKIPQLEKRGGDK